jgi:predicted DNA-binding protein (UPF0251 family)
MRSKIRKIICCRPKASDYIPIGIDNPEIVYLTREEVESLDLKNNKGYDQIEAARKMGISQSTFQRILTSSYYKVSDAIVNGKIINIQKL